MNDLSIIKKLIKIIFLKIFINVYKVLYLLYIKLNFVRKIRDWLNIN